MIIIKSPEDIKKLKKACKISADVLQYAGEQINAGMSTYELDKLIYDFIVAAGAKPSFLGYGGFKGSALLTFTVYPYSPPTCSITGHRVDKDGNPHSSGTFAYFYLQSDQITYGYTL